MNWNKISLYFVVPIVVTLPMIFMYFSGNVPLQHVISPEIEGLYGNSNRELGLLENLENVLLVAILVILARAFVRLRGLWPRAAVGVLILGTTFIFLEELDYGLHYYEYFAGIDSSDAVKERNWHNVGKRTNTTKQLVDTGMVVFFLVIPFACHGSAFRWVRLLTPDRYAGLTLIAMLIVRTTAHGLQDAGFGTPGTMDSNLSEFRELVTYYLFTLYLQDVFEQRMDYDRSPPQTPATEDIPAEAA